MTTVSKKSATALFVGRFQPFHQGHYLTILDLGSQYKNVIIGIGSAQAGFTADNPFTSKEREKMIRASLAGVSFDWSLFPIPDIDNDSAWVHHVESIVGKFDVAYSGNTHCIKLFKQAQIPTFTQRMIQRHRYWGTEIRKRMHKKDTSWLKLVPEPVAEILQTIHAKERLLTLGDHRALSHFTSKIPKKLVGNDLFSTVMTHTSFLHEHPDKKIESNERLEFLGDAVLQVVVTEGLYATYPDAPEGTLTSKRSSLVRTEALADQALKLDLGEYLRMGLGEEKNGGRNNQTVLAGAFEALLGAMYLVCGAPMVKKFIEKHVLADLPETLSAEETKDSKTRLQEFLQGKYRSLPTYKVVSEVGPDHGKRFTFAVYFDGVEIGRGSGQNKQTAQQEAAGKALEGLIKAEDTSKNSKL